MAQLLYFGELNAMSTSGQRAKALQRLGHQVAAYNPFAVLDAQPASRWVNPLHYRSGYRLLQPVMQRWLQQVLAIAPKPDLIWVDSGELFGPGCLRQLRALGCPVVLYNVDDPTGSRDGRRFDSLLRTISSYDLVVVVRRETEEEARVLGARKVLRVLRSYDEIAHQPFANVADIPAKFHSEVIFIGTWMPHEKRDEFMLELVRQGVPLTIWGPRWERSPHWATLQGTYRGGGLSGRDYVAAIQGAKLCLGLLSKGNRDLHTQRSLEVPFAGGLFCAERTTEHQEMYRENEEAVFWSDAAECATVCQTLLADDARREHIRLAGMRRVRALGVGHEEICRRILQEFNLTNV
jgi:spore maturation protein CgeB